MLSMVVILVGTFWLAAGTGTLALALVKERNSRYRGYFWSRQAGLFLWLQNSGKTEVDFFGRYVVKNPQIHMVVDGLCGQTRDLTFVRHRRRLLCFLLFLLRRNRRWSSRVFFLCHNSIFPVFKIFGLFWQEKTIRHITWHLYFGYGTDSLDKCQ